MPAPAPQLDAFFPVVPSVSRDDALSLAVQRLVGRSQEQKALDRERLLKSTPEPRPIPEGKTLFDVVEGTWPGEETEEQICDMLERMS